MTLSSALEQNLRLAYFVLRVATGVNLFGHGFIRLLGNYEGFRQWLITTMGNSLLPDFLIQFSAWVIPPLELVLGALLILGFKTRETLLVASGLLISLIFGSCLIQNWEIVSIQMIYILIYSLLLAFASFNGGSLDSLKGA